MKRHAPQLLADEPIELAPVLVEPLDPALDRRPRFAAFVDQRDEFAFQGPRSFRHLRAPLRKVEKKVGHLVQRRVRVAKNLRVSQRTDRQLMRVIGPDGETSVALELEPQLAAPELFPVLRAEHRRQKLALLRRPIDVEPTRILGMRAPLQNIEPQRVVGAPHAHVVGNDIEDSAEPLAAEGFDHCREVGLRPEFRVQLIVISDVIAVQAAGSRFKDRRKIDMTDPSRAR